VIIFIKLVTSVIQIITS